MLHATRQLMGALRLYSYFLSYRGSYLQKAWWSYTRNFLKRNLSGFSNGGFSTPGSLNDAYLSPKGFAASYLSPKGFDAFMSPTMALSLSPKRALSPTSPTTGSYLRPVKPNGPELAQLASRKLQERENSAHIGEMRQELGLARVRLVFMERLKEHKWGASVMSKTRTLFSLRENYKDAKVLEVHTAHQKEMKEQVK